MTTKSPVYILDGGLGTSLEDKYGVAFSSAATPLWSSHLLLSAAGRDTLAACQRDFAAVPVDVLETATYQFSEQGLRATVGEEVGAEIALALALGPYGACMVPSTEYSGVYDGEHDSAEALERWHGDRLRLFYTGVRHLQRRVGYVAFETVPRTDEIVAIRRLMMVPENEDTAPLGTVWPGDRPPRFWISCVYPGDGEALPDGSSPEQVVEAVLGGGASSSSGAVPWGIGINCTKVGRLPSLVARYEAAVAAMMRDGRLGEWPSLVIYPDGTNGEVYNTETQRWELPEGRLPPETPWEIQLAEVVKAAAGRGNWRSILTGGCCKTTDSDINALRAAIHGGMHGKDLPRRTRE